MTMTMTMMTMMTIVTMMTIMTMKTIDKEYVFTVYTGCTTGKEQVLTLVARLGYHPMDNYGKDKTIIMRMMIKMKMKMKMMTMMTMMTTISKEQVLTLVARLGATRFCREPTQATTCHPSICCSCHDDDDDVYGGNDDDNDGDDDDDDNDHHKDNEGQIIIIEPTQATTCHPSICCSCHDDDDYDCDDSDDDHHICFHCHIMSYIANITNTSSHLSPIYLLLWS